MIDILDVGTILLVKKPYYKILDKDEYEVGVDHLCDVVQPSKSDAVTIPFPREWQSVQIGVHTALGRIIKI